MMAKEPANAEVIGAFTAEGAIGAALLLLLRQGGPGGLDVRPVRRGCCAARLSSEALQGTGRARMHVMQAWNVGGASECVVRYGAGPLHSAAR
uniref:hypothetical protein n=1 Tax=Salmonella enterica TaxID=28901 RepID=UPI003524B284